MKPWHTRLAVFAQGTRLLRCGPEGPFSHVLAARDHEAEIVGDALINRAGLIKAKGPQVRAEVVGIGEARGVPHVHHDGNEGVAELMINDAWVLNKIEARE